MVIGNDRITINVLLRQTRPKLLQTALRHYGSSNGQITMVVYIVVYQLAINCIAIHSKGDILREHKFLSNAQCTG